MDTVWVIRASRLIVVIPLLWLCPLAFSQHLKVSLLLITVLIPKHAISLVIGEPFVSVNLLIVLLCDLIGNWEVALDLKATAKLDILELVLGVVGLNVDLNVRDDLGVSQILDSVGIVLDLDGLWLVSEPFSILLVELIDVLLLNRLVYPPLIEVFVVVLGVFHVLVVVFRVEVGWVVLFEEVVFELDIGWDFVEGGGGNVFRNFDCLLVGLRLALFLFLSGIGCDCTVNCRFLCAGYGLGWLSFLLAAFSCLNGGISGIAINYVFVLKFLSNLLNNFSGGLRLLIFDSLLNDFGDFG
jgi:hypothetical protein